MFKKRLLFLSIASAFYASSPVVYAQEVKTEEDLEQEALAADAEVLLEEVVIYGVRSAELNARDVERNKKAFSNVIAQDDAGNFADQNVAESLQRLPGISLQKTEGEGRFVSVRGLGPGFVSVSLDGNELATAGADNRAFALDSLSPDSLGAIEVYKSLLPSMDLNSIGGSVNVKTISPFERENKSLKFNAQTYYQDYASEASPKLSFQGTLKNSQENFGVSYSATWEQRATHSYEVRHHENTLPREVQRDLPQLPAQNDEPSLTIPWEFQNRQEDAERTRKGATLGLAYRPTESSEYALRGSYSSLRDLDLAWREYYRFGQAQSSDIAFIDNTSGLFGVLDSQVQQQMFIQDGESDTLAFAFDGKNILPANSGEWTIEYNLSASQSEFDKPDGRRVQFRVTDIPTIGRTGQEFITGAVVSPEEMAKLAGLSVDDFIANTDSGQDLGRFNGYGTGLTANNFNYDNLFLEQSTRQEDLQQIAFDLTKEFISGNLRYIKFGAQQKSKERERNKDRWSLRPSSYNAECGTDQVCSQWINGNLSDFSYQTVDHPYFDFPAITYNAAEELIGTTRVIATPENQRVYESDADDYTITEDTFAAYVEAEFTWLDVHSLIVGARWDKTEFYSSGGFTINNDDFAIGRNGGSAISLDYSIPLTDTDTEYDNLLPSVHYRYEARDDLLIRASLWTSFTRPSFDQARAFAEINSNFSLCNPATGICAEEPSDTLLNPGIDPEITQQELRNFSLSSNNTLEFGNPTLEAMTSTNFDLSLSWYADKDLYLQAAVFYKDIKDFIAEVNGSPTPLNALPIQLPVDQISEFAVPLDTVVNVDWNINGESASVYGMELSYSQYFKTGLFVQSNLTLMTSSARLDDSYRDEDTKLTDQADTTFNLTFGWENEQYSARLISNYRSPILAQIGASSTFDIYQSKTFSLDFKTSYQVTEQIKLYFDATNITDDYAIYYFEGNEGSNGKMLYQSELFGRAFQVGMNYKF